MYLTQEEINKMLNIKDEYEKADYLVKILFKNKTDREGKEYYYHLKRVSEKLDNKKTRVAGLLHDTVEDIEFITFKTLEEIGFDKEIIELVKIVTNDKSIKMTKEKYHEKITKIIESNNIEAIKLKYSDMSDNFNKERMKNLPKEEQEYLTNKYKDEIERLKNKIKER